MRKLLYLLPLAAFIALAGYFAVALRSDRDPHELPSALIDKPAPAFRPAVACWAARAVASSALAGPGGGGEFLRLLVRAVPASSIPC